MQISLMWMMPKCKLDTVQNVGQVKNGHSVNSFFELKKKLFKKKVIHWNYSMLWNNVNQKMELDSKVCYKFA